MIEALRIFRAATEPDDDACARVARRLRASATTPAATRVLLQRLPRAPSTAVDRVRHRIASAEAPRGARRGGGLRLGLATAGGLALVAAAVAIVAIAWPDATLDVPLDAGSAWATSAPVGGVTARYLGHGQVVGTPHAPVFHWQQGDLELDVDPARRLRVTVRTAEAEATVVGTLFTVRRSALGTSVEVSHGTVDVRCAGRDPERVTSGHHRQCQPTTPAGLLGRARAMEDRGAPQAEILDAVRAGLAAGAEGAVRAELLALEVDCLARLVRPTEALAAARAFLRSGADLRRVDVARVGADLALEREGCAGALPFVTIVLAADPTAEERQRYGRCVRRE